MNASDLSTTVEHAVMLARQQVLSKPIKVEYTPAHNLPAVEHDSDQMHQVLLNLLLNSVQAIEGSGMIRVAVFPQSDAAVITVTDTGRGIPPEHLQRHSMLGFVVALILGLGPKAPGQTYADLHDFDCYTDGCSPEFPEILAQGRDGNLYTTVTSNGTHGAGTVVKIMPSGTVTTLYSFSGLDGQEPWGGLTLGSDGNFYGTTSTGGDYGYGTIFKITPAGTFTKLHSFDSADCEDPYLAT